jgi:thioredoxin-like negative regulator of GroEL
MLPSRRKIARSRRDISIRRVYYKRIGTAVNLRLVLSNEPDNHKAKLRLAEVYEAQNEPKKALALVYEGIRQPLRTS